MERMDQLELDQMAADIGYHERCLAELRSQMRQAILFQGDQRCRTIRGRLFEFFARPKTLEVRRAQ